MKVAFTGHRNYPEVKNEQLRKVVEQFISEGYTTFLCGMAEGFDIAAAEVVLSLKTDYPQLRLLSVIPFEGHDMAMPNAEWAERYRRIVEAADEVVTISPSYNVNIYRLRNDYLVDNADAIICYYSGNVRTGTGYTVRRAMKKCLRMVNLYADSYQIQFFG